MTPTVLCRKVDLINYTTLHIRLTACIPHRKDEPQRSVRNPVVCCGKKQIKTIREGYVCFQQIRDK